MVSQMTQLARRKKNLFNGENWISIPQGKAKLRYFKSFEILAVAAMCEKVFQLLWNSYPGAQKVNNCA